MTRLDTIDSIERDLSHIRNLDPALLESLIRRLDELRRDESLCRTVPLAGNLPHRHGADAD
jgi:hypothetical protein